MRKAPPMPRWMREQQTSADGEIGTNIKMPPSMRPSERLTKREMFAAMAMQGLCSHSGDYHHPAHLAQDAVMYANALLAELERTK